MKGTALAWASVLAAVLVLSGLAPMIGNVKGAIPIPHNTWGHPFDETGTRMDVDELITSWIDGVEYGRNMTFTAVSDIWYDVDTSGNWRTSPTEPNTPWRKEGGDIDEPIMFALGDMTNIDLDPDDDGRLDYGVFIESDLWMTAIVVHEDLNLSSTQPPSFPKISWIVPEPTGGNPDYALIYTKEPFFDMSGFYLEKNDGSLYGPSQVLTGVSNGTAYFYANLTGMDLDGCGDELKLVWNNTGLAFGGRDIVVDRVEWNATSGGTHYIEPDNTVMTDAVAPACPTTDFALRRKGTHPVYDQDTNDNAADFVVDTPWPKPTTGSPIITILAPAGGEAWTGGTIGTLVSEVYDDNLRNDQLEIWVNYSLDDGGTWSEAIINETTDGPLVHPFRAWGDVANPMVLDWTLPFANTTLMRIQLCAVSPAGGSFCAESNRFTIDSDLPKVNPKLNGLNHVRFYVDEVIPDLYLWARIHDGGRVAGANYTIGRNNWPGLPLYADDGAFDGTYELAKVHAAMPPPTVGIYEYCVYAWDEAGNQNQDGDCVILELTNDISDEDTAPPESADLNYIQARPDHNHLRYELSASLDAWLYRLEYSNQYQGSYLYLDEWETPLIELDYYHYGAGSDNPDDFYYRLWVADHHMNWAISGVIAKVNVRLEEGARFLAIPTSNEWSDYSNLDQIWESFDEIRYYNPSDVNDPWKSFSRAKPYRDFEDLEFGRGYWIDMTRNDTIIASGQILPTVRYDLVAGWNLVGYCSPYSRTVADALTGISEYQVEGYSDEEPYHLQRLTSSSLMEPHQAYWIWVPSDTTWVLMNET